MKVTLVKINLVRNIILRNNQNDFKTKYTFNDKVMKKIFKVEVRSGTKDIFNFIFPLNQMPDNEFSFFDNINLYNWTKSNCEFMPSINSNIISCQYLLKITLYFDSFIKKSDRPRLRIPIIISHKLEKNINNLHNNINRATLMGEEVNENEIRKQKKDDFVFFNKNSNIINNNQNDKNGKLYEKLGSSNSFNKSKTINNDYNNSYIENMANNNKIVNNNEKEMPSQDNNKQNNINNKEENKKNKNNNNFNSRIKTYIENNSNIINNNEDQDEAPTWKNINKISENNINNI